MYRVAALLSLLTIAVDGHAVQVQTSTVRFGPEGRYSGYLARPVGQGPFPGLVVIHEWWGLNDNVRGEARRLAETGYAALAVDLFGKSTTDPQEAMRMSRGLDQKAANAEMLAAANYLRLQPFVRADRVGSIGWCFGGAQSLNLALNDPRLRAAVIYYGRPVTDVQELRKINAAVLGIFGEADESIPMNQVDAFQNALAQAGVEHRICTYPGAGHAFANPSRGDAYKPEAARDAWRKTLEFLDTHLKR